MIVNIMAFFMTAVVYDTLLFIDVVADIRVLKADKAVWVINSPSPFSLRMFTKRGIVFHFFDRFVLPFSDTLASGCFLNCVDGFVFFY